jgi:hypothetical protein
MAEVRWVQRWNTWIAPTPAKPGVWRRKEGGYLVRGRAVDPRTGKIQQVRLNLPDVDATAAYDRLHAELKRIRAGEPQPQAERVRFCDYAVSLLDRKIKSLEIKSAKGRETWGVVLEHHLIPAFGEFYVDQLRYADILRWKDKVAGMINAGKYSPVTANGWFRVMRVITKAAAAEYELPRDPSVGIKDFDTSLHQTYTEEEPNSLLVEETMRFLSKMWELYPQFFAMTALGFALGLRPSSLRPLRRGGATPDLLLDQGILYLRRSHSLGEEVMETTKTKRRQRIALPEDLIEILRWHIDRLPAGPQRDSELLFPSIFGGFHARSLLDKPFREVAKAAGITKHITPKAMRRTFQDLARAAEVKDVVTRAISGHATETMQHHYSTVNAGEMRSSLAKVVSLAGFRAAMASSTPGGLHSGLHGPEALTSK